MSAPRTILIAAVLSGMFFGAAEAAEPFTYKPPGELLPDSGQGLAETKVYAPDMLFPLEGRGYANSQVYRPGGYLGPPGSQCDASNYDYPWQDNYCETRSWTMPLCPAGKGHQGQDIRPESCDDQVHYTVAAESATVTNVGTYSVYITAPNGKRYDYLHGRQNAVSNGQGVNKGQKINKVSNNMGDTPTSIHLHFNIKQDVAGYGNVYVSPYMSLVEAYEEKWGLTNKPPKGAHDAADCDSIRGWAQDPDAPDQAIKVHVYFNGPTGDPNATGIEVAADEHRDDLCQPLGSCEHGFTVEIPRSLRDNAAHPVHTYGIDTEGGENTELDASPKSFTCPPPALPPGVRRHISSPEVLAAWKFSTFWQLAKVDDATLAAIEEWEPIEPAPLLIRADDGSPEVWLVDGPVRRHVSSPAVAAAWGFDLGTVVTLPAADVSSMEIGTPVWDEPFLVQGTGPSVFALDDVQCWDGSVHPACQDGGSTGDSSDSSDPSDPSGTSGSSDSGETGGSGDSGGTGGSGGGSGDGSGGTAGGGETDGDTALPPGYGIDGDDAGCDCNGGAGSFGAFALLLLAPALRRRRRAS